MQASINGQVAVDPGLLREIGDLKRIRSAGRAGSTAERLFLQGWAALWQGVEPANLWPRITAAALCAARLGDINEPLLVELGLSPAQAQAVLRRALGEFRPVLGEPLAARLESALSPPLPFDGPPAFATSLAVQPRAGVTCPGRPRLMLEPPENHAEHCLVVAIYGVLLAGRYGADPGTVFLAAMAHHLHNAAIPDSGFTGEMLLETHLDPLFRAATEKALAELPAALAARVTAARGILPDAGTPEGRAFHAADTLDRVLQIEQHLRAGRATMHHILHEMHLVHEGPVKAFQDEVLAEAGLLR